MAMGKLRKALSTNSTTWMTERTLIVAPEALSRFYFGGFSGKVGASWMTKEDREDEIDDYINYLQQIYEFFINQLSSNVRITLFGFSQGGTTQSRFALLKKPLFHHLILWAGNFAHDLDYLESLTFLAEKKIFLVIGDNDEFITEDRREEILKFLVKNRITCELIDFKGTHKIDRKVLGELVTRL